MGTPLRGVSILSVVVILSGEAVIHHGLLLPTDAGGAVRLSLIRAILAGAEEHEDRFHLILRGKLPAGIAFDEVGVVVHTLMMGHDVRNVK